MPTARQLFAIVESRLVSIAIGARPTAPGDGVDVTNWLESGVFCGAMAAVFIGGNGADGTLTAPASGDCGVELWGYRLSKWWLISGLRDGRDIAVYSDGRGYSQAVNVIGVFNRLAVAGSGVAAVAQIAPIEAWR